MEMETNASVIARETGRLSGIEKVKKSPNSYSLYSLADRNQKEAEAYSSGFLEGNASGIAYVFSNRLTYGLSADIERDARILDSRQRGESEGIKAGACPVRCHCQADLSRHGLALVEYLETTEPTPYTYNWFYQPGAGWLWTDKSVFPYFYLSTSEALKPVGYILILNERSSPLRLPTGDLEGDRAMRETAFSIFGLKFLIFLFLIASFNMLFGEL